MDRSAAHATQLVDDARVRVTRFDFAPGAQTGWHTHAMDYVITPVTACTMDLEEPDGSIRSVVLQPGDSYRRDAGIKHNVINAGTAPMTFVEVELK